jgi:acyl-homoserine lactone acylase PvdQ
MQRDDLFAGYEQGQRDMLTKCITAIESIPEDMNSSAEWDRDYDVDETGKTRNPRIWVREATAALHALSTLDPTPRG